MRRQYKEQNPLNNSNIKYTEKSPYYVYINDPLMMADASD